MIKRIGGLYITVTQYTSTCYNTVNDILINSSDIFNFTNTNLIKYKLFFLVISEMSSGFVVNVNKQKYHSNSMYENTGIRE
jgi:hypothetical protein